MHDRNRRTISEHEGVLLLLELLLTLLQQLKQLLLNIQLVVLKGSVS